MALDIVILKRAEIKLDRNIEYLENKGGETSAKEFVLKFDSFINTLSSFPEIGSFHKGNIRAYVLVKQVTVFYRVTSKQIIIVNLFLNRQDHKRK